MTSTAFDEDMRSAGENLTLEEFLNTLSDSDKKLVKDLPLDVDELLMLTSEEFAGFRDKHLPSTEEQQNRRLQIIITLSRLAIYARLDKDARKEPGLVKEEYQSQTQSQSQIQPAEPYSQLKLLEKYNNLRNVTLENIPKLWLGLEFALSVKSILNIKGCTLPFAGIILGPASSLKTVIIELFRECHHTFYTDNFSAKAFVSHNSAVKKEKLKEIDMLPRIKNKFFLTPELAPTFAQREEELIQTLGIMTRILDGHGYESDTGAQGHRGYNEDIMFAWLGAAVDIPHKVHRQLSVLGPKLYFYRLARSEETEDYYYDKRNENFGDRKQAIQKALMQYLLFFEANRQITIENDLPKIPLKSEKDEELAHRCIIRLAQLLAHLRAVVPTWETKNTQGSDYAYAIPNIEDPSRAMTQLRNLARGHALSQGRNCITEDDIPILVNVVFSTASMERVRIFELLITNKGSITSSQIVYFLNTTNPTARRTMTELKAIGLVNMYPDTDTDDNDYGTANVEKEIELKPEFQWFLSDEFAELRGLKEKCTPRASLTSVPVPLLLYEYTIIKKLNLIRDFSFKQDVEDDERPRVGQISFSNDMVLEETSLTDSTEHKSNQYPCDFTKPRNAGKLYRVGHSDRHGCEDCNIKDDIYYMRDHKCSGYKPT